MKTNPYLFLAGVAAVLGGAFMVHPGLPLIVLGTWLVIVSASQ